MIIKQKVAYIITYYIRKKNKTIMKQKVASCYTYYNT